MVCEKLVCILWPLTPNGLPTPGVDHKFSDLSIRADSSCYLIVYPLRIRRVGETDGGVQFDVS